MGDISRIRAYIQSEYWAIDRRTLDTIVAVVEARAIGARSDFVASGERPQPETRGSVAVLPIHGVLFPHADMVSEISGGTSVSKLQRAFDDAIADSSVRSIILSVHSPGGAIFGVQEFADRIFASRGRKPVTAVVNMQAASAAYWLASQADSVVVSPSGEVGSIGVFTTHEDWSKFWSDEGVATTYIQAGAFKTEMNEHAPLTDEARAYAQTRIDGYYSSFVDAVARGRKTSAERVRASFGKGRMVGASDALALGMVDRVATLDAVLAEQLAPTTPVPLAPPAVRHVDVAIVRRRLQLARLVASR